MRLIAPGIILSLLCCLFISIADASQAESGQSLRIDQFSVHNGLSQNSITGMLKDADGFLWIATGAGLNRFDGHQFQLVKGPEGVFESKYISMLTQTSDGLIWVAIPNAGIYSLTPGHAQFVQRVEEELHDEWWFAETTNIFLHQGQYYFTNDNSLRRLDPTTNEVTLLYEVEQESESYYDIVRHAYPEQEFIFIATSAGLEAYNLNTGRVTEIDHLGGEQGNVNQINTKYLLPHDGELLIATVQGLYGIDIDDLVHSLREGVEAPHANTYDPDLNIWQMVHQDDQVLLATQTGLHTIAPQASSPSLKLKFSDSDLPVFDNSIHHVGVDDDNNIWLGTPFNGLFQWRPETKRFTTIAKGMGAYPKLSNNQVWAIAQDTAERLWVGTQNGLNLIDWTQQTHQHEIFLTTEDDSAYYHEGVVYDIFPDPHDADIIWLYQSDYMFEFKVSTGVATPLAELVDNTDDQTLLAEGFFWSYQLIDERIWFADAAGIYAFDTQSRTLHHYTEFSDKEFDLMNLYTFIGTAPGQSNQLLLGLASEVWLYDFTSGEVERLYRHEPFHRYADIYVESMVEDDQGRLWLSMMGVGLLVFDTDSLEHLFTLGLAEGLPTRDMYQGRLDANGYLWFSSMAGLLRLNTTTYHVERFTYREGTSSNEFNYNASVSLTDGRFAYGSMRGITLFDPLHLEPTQRQLRTRISAINYITTGERLPLPLQDLSGQSVQLPHDSRGIRVEVSTSSLDRPYEVRYHYQLSGPESLNIESSRETSISFPRLRPGNYNLQITAIDPRTGTRGSPAVVAIKVDYHPLLSPLALLIYVFLILLLLAILLRYRHQQHQRLLQSKLRAERSEERLSLAVSATQSGIWDWHRQHDRVFDTRLQDDLGYSELTDDLDMALLRGYVHYRDLPQVNALWQAMLSGERDNFNCTYRMRHADGSWLWYHDIGHVTRRNQHGEPERVTGVFQNITLARSTEEKAMLFGQAFEQTQDWVLLLNSEQLPMTANRAFCQAAGIDESNLTDFEFTNMTQERLYFYRDILLDLQPGEQWRGEDVVSMVNRASVPVLMNISAVADPLTGSRAYVIVMTDISAQKAAEQQLRKLANYDALTGLPNRVLLNQELDQLLQQAVIEPTNQIGLMFMDLDRFKQINDSLGHSVGDSLLCIIAERVKGCVRGDDTVARLGGDEFIILMQAPNESAIRETAERVLQAVNEPLVIDKNHIRVSPSIGIALYPQHGNNRDELLKHADVAMYEAKDSGRNRYRMFRAEMDTRVRERLNLELELKQAVSRGDLRNAYQPIINAAHKECVGVELLLRWTLNDNHISPDVFIPLAEDLGLIVHITEQAMREALADLKRLREYQPTMYLSVNLSVRHLDYDSLPEHVSDLLEEFDLPASALRFELTEGILIEETVRAGAIMHQLRELGIQLMLDDFGTGYSSLRYLKDFPLSVIKIDRGFTADIGCDKSDEAIIESILAMATNLDKVCVAEGVETDAQRKWLLTRGCFLMQGYLFSPAKPITDLLAWLAKYNQPEIHLVNKKRRGN
ncbi:MAG: EAL domain-containing protein [Idiomarina sp.]|nr:EAL domain-containing protein [Idiomarina sp.]